MSLQSSLIIPRCVARFSVFLLLSRSAIAAAAPPPTTRPVPVAVLSNGTRVEVLGIMGLDEQAHVTWWAADGTPRNGPPIQGQFRAPSTQASRNNVEIIVRFSGTDSSRNRWNALNMQWKSAGASLGLSGIKTSDGKVLADTFAFMGWFPEEQIAATLTFNFAMKPGSSYAQLDAGKPGSAITEDVPPLGKVTLLHPRALADAATLTATVPTPPPGWQAVVIAVPKGRGFILPDGGTAIGGTEGKPRDIIYHGKIADIRRFELRLRDYTPAVEFKDISLRPGSKTTPTIIVREPAGNDEGGGL